ncbi:hypothetical protein OWV82_006829 [Melia azedarach]|uniref:Uncharacterized protein n=1 Tax=Melia azedarach TaxID=155640 RepID=A0ACC1YI36_MELAZ|nr:hypothetical protein OWV82_006829 [Melia azedarach]
MVRARKEPHISKIIWRDAHAKEILEVIMLISQWIKQPIEEKSVFDLIESCFREDGYVNDRWDPTDEDPYFAEDWDRSVLNPRKIEILQVYQEEKENSADFQSTLVSF